MTRNAAERLSIGELAALPFKAELVEPKDIDRITGSDAVHQGVLIEAEPRPRRRRPAAARAAPPPPARRCTPQPAGIRRSGEIRVRGPGAYRPDRGEEPRRCAGAAARGRFPDDRT
nr:hypothetical protein [Mesorhizobium sp. M2A.F.Ca.ET.043.02.1.1]